MSEGKTGGQAAYVTVATRDDDLWIPWPELTDEGRAIWEAAAAAASAAAHERTAELASEANEAGRQRARALNLVAEILAEFTGDDRGAAALVTPQRLAGWRRQAGLDTPAVVTSGTQHLAEQLHRVAIADEAP